MDVKKTMFSSNKIFKKKIGAFEECYIIIFIRVVKNFEYIYILYI